MQRNKALLTAAATLMAHDAAGQDLNALLGDWQTVRHAAQVRITDCGNGSPCGHLISVDRKVRDGRTHDTKNPDPDLRDRSIQGLPILWGYGFGDDRWQGGRLYNPETGQTFRSTIKLVAPDSLRVTGCRGPLCRTQTWSRTTGNHPNTKDEDDQ